MTENQTLRAALETIASLAVGEGDVCEIIARRARAALTAPSTEQAKPVAWQRRDKWSDFTVRPGWQPWELCTEKEFDELTVAIRDLGQWSEVRKLYATPQPQPAIPAAPIYKPCTVAGCDQTTFCYGCAKDRPELVAAIPAAPEQKLRAELQMKCCNWGAYWRASDSHGVMLSFEQAHELLRDAIAVEVEIKLPPEELVAQQAAPEQATPAITTDERAAYARFFECAQDGEGHDVPTEMMQRLAEIGLVRHSGGGRYTETEFGMSQRGAATSPQQRDESRGEDYKRLYEELVYQVSRKHPNETRHQTALRYLRRAEVSRDDQAVAVKQDRTS